MRKNSKKGLALYLVIIIVVIVLAVVLGLTTLLVKQIKIARSVEDSVKAYYAAEVGAEQALKDLKDDNPIQSYEGSINGADYDVKVVCCAEEFCSSSFLSCPFGESARDDNCESPAFCVRSKGVFNGSVRALEVEYVGPAEPLQYDFYMCGLTGEIGGFGTAFPIGWSYYPWKTYGKLYQTFKPSQNYIVAGLDLIIGRTVQRRSFGECGINGDGLCSGMCGPEYHNPEDSDCQCISGDGLCPPGCTLAEDSDCQCISGDGYCYDGCTQASPDFDDDCIGLIDITIARMVDDPAVHDLSVLGEVNSPYDDYPDMLHPVCSTQINGDFLVNYCSEGACNPDPVESNNRGYWRTIVFDSECNLQEDVVYAIVIEDNDIADFVTVQEYFDCVDEWDYLCDYLDFGYEFGDYFSDRDPLDYYDLSGDEQYKYDDWWGCMGDYCGEFEPDFNRLVYFGGDYCRVADNHPQCGIIKTACHGSTRTYVNIVGGLSYWDPWGALQYKDSCEDVDLCSRGGLSGVEGGLGIYYQFWRTVID